MAKNTVAKATSTSTVKTTGRAAIVRKALAQDNKSEGMRMLFDAGMTVVEVKETFNAPYGYVYGVALRHGVAATAASRRVAKAAPTKSTRSARPAAKVTKTASAPAKRATATKPSAASRVAAKIAGKTKGRPTAARRAANRKPRQTA